MVVLYFYNNVIEFEFGSFYCNIDSLRNVVVYSSFGDNLSMFELNWFDFYFFFCSFCESVVIFLVFLDEEFYLKFFIEVDEVFLDDVLEFL